MITSWKDVRIPFKINWGGTKMGQVNLDNVEDVFTYHAPEADQLEAFVKVRTALTAAAKIILETVPECADRTVAIRKLREARMDANSAIALCGKI